MRSDLARDILNNAGHHIASLGSAFLEAEGRTLRTHGKQIGAWNMHSVLLETCGETEPEEWIQCFHVLREMRNCITHAGGCVSQKLRDAVADMGADARSGWKLETPAEVV